jgi:hypothetical protein
MEYTPVMWEVEYTDEFREWWDSLNRDEQAVIDSGVTLIEQLGPSLPYPAQKTIPLCILFCFFLLLENV